MTRERTVVFPLYVYPGSGGPPIDSPWPAGRGGRKANLNGRFVREMERQLGLSFTSDGAGDLKTDFGPEDVLRYVYAILHSPTYRKQYATSLRFELPRVPPSPDRLLFRTLCQIGGQLIDLHLMRAVAPRQPGFPERGTNCVATVRYAEGRVGINDQQFFEGVPESVWDFRVGGYQVCEKWLKDRKGRKLSHDDLTHYRGIVANLAETIRLMREIDTAIPGWPLPGAWDGAEPLPVAAEPAVKYGKTHATRGKRRP